jgi:hypothetical protein
VTIELDDRDLEVLETLVRVWDEHQHLLPGGLSYQDVLNLTRKLGQPDPPELMAFLSWAEKKRTTRV